jgi:hypothetical protein
MITVYEIKPNGYLGQSKQVDPRKGVGATWTYTPPPGDGPHEWVSGVWYPRAAESLPFMQGPDTVALADSVREERNARLAACDWTQVADAPVDREAWAVYRQALRDVTGQADFPMYVQWPENP